MHLPSPSHERMSIDLNWETLTTGPDGAELAERIRLFIHEKFQTVPLPRFIRSVEVLGFDFGTIPPDLELKDITDPLPEFYDAEDDSDLDSDDDQPTKRPRPLRTEIPADAQDLTSPFLGIRHAFEPVGHGADQQAHLHRVY